MNHPNAITHQQQHTLESILEGEVRTYVINRSQHLGYGFVAGNDWPTIVKMVEPRGPSYKKLLVGDVIMAVNGISVVDTSREKIIQMIQLCGDQMEIKVRQPTYEEMLRAKSLVSDSKFYNNNYANNNFNKQAITDRQPPPLPPPSNGAPTTPQAQAQAPPLPATATRQPPLMPASDSPLNRLVTSIAHQRLSSPTRSSLANDGTTPPVQVKPQPPPLPQTNFNGQKSINGGSRMQLDQDENCRTLGRKHINYGRHSPLPQRCKSSMDGTQTLGPRNKANGDQSDKPLLKRSNTMRPIKPPQRVMEILEVIIKIFFEDGHTRVLKYNQDTTVGAILETLNSRMTADTPHSEQIKRYFGLALTVGLNSDNSLLLKKNRLHILDDNYSIMKIRQLPYAPSLRLLYRMVNPPTDVNALYLQDKVAFDYLYQQSCNDLKLERFNPDLEPDVALKLSALHLLEYIYSNHSKAHGNSRDPKILIKLIKKAPGIEFFLPKSIAESAFIVDKKGKRMINQTNQKKLRARLSDQLRKNFEEFDFEPPKVRLTTDRYSSTSFHEVSLPEMQSRPNEYIKLLFMNHLAQLPCYGNSEKPIRTSSSPAERNSAGDCSSSLESVPRTSDSSPLIRQDRNQNSQNNNGRAENNHANNTNSISRLAQMNSIRSLSSMQSSINSQPVDTADMAQTPSIESISSITFNTQGSPSPQPAPVFTQTQQNDTSYSLNYCTTPRVEPSPKPRNLIPNSRAFEYNTIDKLYSLRYQPHSRHIDELLKKVILPPPPSPVMMSDPSSCQIFTKKDGQASMVHLTRALTDMEIEQLRTPPPPSMWR